MAVQLPNGTIIEIAAPGGAAKPITSISNAKPGVASAVAHGLTDGTILVVSSNWSPLNDAVFRVANPMADTFELEGSDTSNVKKFPAGGGAGSVRVVSAFTEIDQVLELSTSGGEQQFANYGFLRDANDKQIPTTRSAQSMSVSIADDPSLAGYQIMEAAAESREPYVVKMTFPNGAVWLCYCYVSFNKTPTMQKNSVMACSGSFSFISQPVRYAD